MEGSAGDQTIIWTIALPEYFSMAGDVHRRFQRQGLLDLLHRESPA